MINHFLYYLLFSIFLSATEASESSFLLREWRDIGEKKTNDYFGVKAPPLANLSKHYSPELVPLSEDEFYIHQLTKQKIQEHPISLSQYWFDELVNESLCPNEELGENLEYIRYLYRLITISYSFESIKRAKRISDFLGLKATNCSVAYKDLFGKCRPKTVEMKKFHQRVSGKFSNEIEKMKFEKWNNGAIALWWKDYSRTVSLSLDPILSRINDGCVQEKMSCRDYTEVQLQDSINRLCNEDKQLIHDACNENDDLFGISKSAKVTELLKSSNAFSLVNKNGYGENCLRRYVKISEKLERRYNYLNRFFTLMSADISKEKGRYLQGDLFLPGALKEFDAKGLSDFLVALEPPKPKTVIKFKPKPKDLPKKLEVKIEKTDIPDIVQNTVENVVEPPKPKVSEFERALADMVRFNSSRSEMDMDLFRSDFEFTQDQFAALEVPLKRFQTRAALIDMKTYDKMGSIESPIGLMFIKFLMDTENHQGLFNIQAIIGKKFYVINDFESKTNPVAVELKNDDSTKGKWVIVLLKSL